MLKRGRGWRRGLEQAFLLDQCSRRKLLRRPCLVQLRRATIVVGEEGFCTGRGSMVGVGTWCGESGHGSLSSVYGSPTVPMGYGPAIGLWEVVKSGDVGYQRSQWGVGWICDEQWKRQW